MDRELVLNIIPVDLNDLICQTWCDGMEVSSTYIEGTSALHAWHRLTIWVKPHRFDRVHVRAA